MDNRLITVSQLNFYTKSLMDSDSVLNNVFICGEISNLTDHYKSGHIYFSLKDEKASIRAVMFAGNAKSLRFKPVDGMQVIIFGSASIYEATGQYQLYARQMQPDGAGDLAVALEQLKEKLSKEGLFDKLHKKPIPKMPERIAVITSPTGAARRDIENILSRRFPIAKVFLYPVLVQGDGASIQLTNAVRAIDEEKLADVIIIGRGGGSAEDLWAFNDEGLARAIFACEIPVISAVGHETDFTICDFVSDMRAPTPSAAAELAVPDMQEILAVVLYAQTRTRNALRKILDNKRNSLERIQSSQVFRQPEKLVSDKMMKLDLLLPKLQNGFEGSFLKKREKYQTLVAKLSALSPLDTIAKGYAIASKNGKSISSVKKVSVGDEIDIRLSDGTFNCTVNLIEEL